MGPKTPKKKARGSSLSAVQLSPVKSKKPAVIGEKPAVKAGKMPTAQGHNKKPWNKGKKMSKTDLQHLLVPREELTLFLAVALFFAGPKYVMVLWVTMVTSRRISEAFQGCDVFLDGGFTHDAPHILFQKREENKYYKGLGKLGADKVVARLAPDVLSTLRDGIAKGVERCVLPPLEPFQQSHPNKLLVPASAADQRKHHVPNAAHC